MDVQTSASDISYNPVTGFVIWMWLVAALALALIPVVWHYRRRSGGYALVLMLFSMAIWNVFSGMEYISTEVVGKVFWMRFTYIGVSLAPSSSLMVGRIFSGDDHRLHPALSILMIAMPILTVLAAFTNQYHGLMWSYIAPELVNGMPVWEFGPWFNVWVMYSYLAFAGTLMIVVRAIVLQHGVYRVQAVGMLVVLLPPWIANALYVFGVELGTLHYYYLTPFASGVSAVMLVINMWAFRFLTQVPVARDQVLECMNQGVLVLDEHHVILDANSALCALFRVERSDILGKNLTTDFPFIQEHLDDIFATKVGLYHELALEDIGNVNVNISPIMRRGVQQPGWVALVENITERKRAEADLRKAHRTLREKVTALEQAQHAIKNLGELVPICAWCGRKIQQEDGTWIEVDKFIEEHSHSEMTHGICPECVEKL